MSLILNINTIVQAKKLIHETIIKNKSGKIKILYKKATNDVPVRKKYEEVLALAFLWIYRSFIVGKYAKKLITPHTNRYVLESISNNISFIDNYV